MCNPDHDLKRMEVSPLKITDKCKYYWHSEEEVVFLKRRNSTKVGKKNKTVQLHIVGKIFTQCTTENKAPKNFGDYKLVHTGDEIPTMGDSW